MMIAILAAGTMHTSHSVAGRLTTIAKITVATFMRVTHTYAYSHYPNNCDVTI